VRFIHVFVRLCLCWRQQATGLRRGPGGHAGFFAGRRTPWNSAQFDGVPRQLKAASPDRFCLPSLHWSSTRRAFGCFVIGRCLCSARTERGNVVGGAARLWSCLPASLTISRRMPQWAGEKAAASFASEARRSGRKGSRIPWICICRGGARSGPVAALDESTATCKV
jgi:hypothetical protein